MTTIKKAFRYVDTGEYFVPPPTGHGGCPGCGAFLAGRLALRALGEKIVLVTIPGCSYRPSPDIPEQRALFSSVASTAAGYVAAIRIRGDKETVVVPWTGDGATYDIGLAMLSGVAERNEDVLYFCFDNEAYQNTGNQRSSATPLGARTTTNPIPATKIEPKKDIMSIVTAHGVPYAATASIAYPDDLMQKVQKAKKMSGFRFLHFFTPCPTGWLYRTEKTIELARLAVETKLFPLFEVEDGYKVTINRQPSGVPLEDYLKPQGRFRSLTPGQIEQLKRDVERRWQRLTLLAKVDMP